MRPVRFSVVLVVLSACGFPRLPSLTGADPGDAAAIDSRAPRDAAAADSATPGPDGCTSFATLLALDTCRLAFSGDVVISGGTVVYDTGTHILTVGGAPLPITHTTVTIAGESVEVISARSLTLDLILLGVIGPLPLVIAASTDIRVGDGALLDVSSGGAGARTACDKGPTAGAPDSGGGAGGGGGGYGAAGGAGGNGDRDGGPSIGGARGAAVATLPAGLRGGCPGAPGGAGGVAGGAGGSAGGALYLVAAGRIELGSSTVVHAGGGPGQGGSRPDAGGGGGGSGGMLLLEAPHIIGPAATIAANGGGGGGGGDPSAAGEAGSAGTRTDARASGGRGTSSITVLGAGIDGGKGGCRSSPAGEDVTAINTGGGGGGGGGVGIIRIRSADLQLGTISPEPR